MKLWILRDICKDVRHDFPVIGLGIWCHKQIRISSDVSKGAMQTTLIVDAVEGAMQTIFITDAVTTVEGAILLTIIKAKSLDRRAEPLHYPFRHD